jgi:putative ABC transport system permease protein
VLGVLRREDAMLIPEADLVSSWDVRASYVGKRFPNGPPRDFRFVSSVARLRDGVSLEAARAELAAFSANLSRAYPKENGAFTTTLRPLADEVTARSRRPLLLLFGATLAVFVLAAFSVAALLLSRALSRQRDVAVRSALGASGWNLVSPLLAEGAALAAAGAVCGLLVASVSVRLLTLAPWAPARAREASVDLRLILFATLAALVATLVATAAPAWALLRADLAPVLREGGGSKGASGGLTRARRLLVVTHQTAATAVLLVGAALLLGSYARLAAVDTGVSAEGVAVLRLSLDKSRYLAGDRAAVFYDDLETRLAALPGVTAVGGVTALPMSTVGVDFMRPCWPEGETAEEARGKGADIRMATPGYFRAIGIPLKAGRLFEKTDGEDAPRVVLVNEALARKAFPLGAVGKRLVIDYLAGAYPYEIVGVVGDTRFAGHRPSRVPRSSSARAEPYLDVVAVKTSAAPWTLTGPIRETVRHGPGSARPQHRAHRKVSRPRPSRPTRFLALLLAALAVSALVLSLAGVAGVLAAEVSQRGRELGIRLALGASPMSVRRTVLGDALGLVLLGGAIGLTAAALLARLLGALLFGVSPLAPWAYAAALLVLAASALVAADGPARRAMRLDPATSLREA